MREALQISAKCSQQNTQQIQGNVVFRSYSESLFEKISKELNFSVSPIHGFPVKNFVTEGRPFL